MAKEGAAVRAAYDGPEVEHDALLGQIEARAADEYARQSDAAESGAKLKAFLEDTNLNGQAFSWLKTIIKKLPKKDGQSKAMDIIRSLEVGLPMVKAHVGGQITMEMDLGKPDVSVGHASDPGQSAPVTAEDQQFYDAVDGKADVVVPLDFSQAARG